MSCETVPACGLLAPIYFPLRWIDAGAAWRERKNRCSEFMQWIHFIYCVTSNEPQTGQMGTSVDWMMLDFNHSYWSDP